MKKTLYFVLTIFMVCAVSLSAEMKLKLSSDIAMNNRASLGNHQLESNLQLELPATITNPGGNEFLKMWMIGVMADVTFPMGDFGDFWSTGFSGHAMVGYMIARSILIYLNAGYTTFTEKDSQEGFDYSFSWIPILIGMNYVFNPGQKFMPFLGLVLGLYLFQNSFDFNYTFFGQTISESGSSSSSEIGIAPRAGFYYLLSATMLLAVTAEYNLIFTEGSTTSALGVLVGLMFALQ